MKKKYFKLTFLLTFTFNLVLSQQILDATLLEVNFSGDSNPRNLTKGVNNIYFSADDGYRGRELWVYDVITDKPRIVKDIRMGNDSSISNTVFITLDDILFFTANNGINGEELWVSDGSDVGTFLLKDINPGFTSSNINNFYIHNDLLFFVANDGVNGRELWVSDGSSVGTYLLKDINIGPSNSLINNFYSFNGSLYFTANDGINGVELWKTDGTTTGTILFKDINIGSQSSFPNKFFVFNDDLFFVANNGINGIEIWKTDGTSENTNMVFDIYNGTFSGLISNSNFLILNDNFYFFANNGVLGFELWKSNGFSNGPSLVKEINVSNNNYFQSINGIIYNDSIIFEAFTPTTGNELWISNGTESGTQLLKNINNSNFSSLGSMPYTIINNKVVFVANDGITGNELWSTDGTTEGTNLIKDINIGTASSQISHLTNVGNYLIFSANDGNDYNTLWKTDGTNMGTTQLNNVNLNQSSNSELKFIEFNGKVYFAGGKNSLNGNELWETDGTLENTKIVDNIFKNSGVISSGQSDFTKFNDKIIFAGGDGLCGIEPFITDGTIEGTKLIKDILPGSSISIWNSQSNRPFFTQAGDYVFFRASNGTGFGYEIFRTDGTEAGTFMVKDIAPGNTSGIDENPAFFGHNGIFYFSANDQIHGNELWRSDGTEEGTFMLKDILPGGLSGIYFSNFWDNHYNVVNRKCFAPIGQYLYFIARDLQGSGLWRTDGSTIGTTKILSISSSGIYDTMPLIIGSNNGKIYFITNTNNSSWGNNSLWVTDGSSAGTILLGQYFMTGTQQFKKSTNLDNFFFYTVFNDNGTNLMKTDGTLAGTSQVTNFNFPFFDRFNFLEKCGDYIYFLVDSSGNPLGKELWRTDGSSENTILIEGFELGDPIFIGNCTCINNHLFYTKGNYIKSFYYVGNYNVIPTQLLINIVNAPNFMQNEGVSQVAGLHNLNNNVLFVGETIASGGELYFSELGNFLSIDNINYNEKQDEIIIYPNPSNGVYNFKFNSDEKVLKAEVFDYNGVKILSNDLEDNFMDCSSLNQGIYLIKVYTRNKVYIKKIIKN
jgi:ELWxxDGT repeat protein